MDKRIEAILDVLSPDRGQGRIPIFEWAHETTPTDEEMVDVAREILAKLDEVS